MAITTVGYDGSINETQWAIMAPRLSMPYWVADLNALKHTVVTTKDRTIRLGPGQFGGVGVMDTSSASEDVSFEAVSSGRRWDLVVARRNWQGTGGLTSFAVVKGGETRALPAFHRSPGVLDDQLLYLVEIEAGRTIPRTVVDLRGFGLNSRVQIMDVLALDGYKNWPGIQAQLGREEYTLQVDRSWVRTGLIAATSPAYRLRLVRNKTLLEGEGMRAIGAGWSVSGDNTMGIQIQRDGRLKFTKAGQYSITGNMWADTRWDNEPGSMKFAMTGLWVKPDFEVHKNAWPSGVNQMFSWAGTITDGDIVDFQAAHYNKAGRKMTFNFEIQIEMMG